LTAFISINLGILNLLPIPALDGGRLIFVLIEWVRRGKRVPPEREGMVHLIGMAVLLTIFVLVAFVDIQRLLDGRSILPR
jgi:regulator of sigma E protease